MRKFLGLAAFGLLAGVVALAAPATSNAQVVVSPSPVVTTAPVVAYRVYRPYHRYYHRHYARGGFRGRSHYHYRHHHARHWRR
jgi:hypothetical protein